MAVEKCEKQHLRDCFSKKKKNKKTPKNINEGDPGGIRNNVRKNKE